MTNTLTRRLSAVAADIVLILHSVIVFFAVFGGFFIFIEPKVYIVHVPVVIWSSVVNLANWTCPLTPFEKWLRQLAQRPSFKGSWIQHYLEPMVRPLGMPRNMELIAGISIVAWNAVVYSGIWVFHDT